MTDEKRCEPPPEMRDVDGWHWLHKDCPVFWIADQGEWDWGNDEFLAPEHVPAGYQYIGPVTPPATIAALVEALENLMDVQTFATGWDNGVTDATGTMNEGDHWHGLAMDRATAALALYRGETGQ